MMTDTTPRDAVMTPADPVVTPADPIMTPADTVTLTYSVVVNKCQIKDERVWLMLKQLVSGQLETDVTDLCATVGEGLDKMITALVVDATITEINSGDDE